ncbi:MAG: hypothetical protein AABP62_25370 [Planctomycetota bacterium]
MNQKRQAKLKKRAEDQQHRDQKKHDLAISALRHAGVYDTFFRLPLKLQTCWLSLIQPAPDIVLHESATDCEQALGLQREFPGFLRLFAQRRCDTRSLPATLHEFYCFLWPLHLLADIELKELRKKGDDLQAAPACDVVALASQMAAFVERHGRHMESDFLGAVWTTTLYNTDP